MTGAVLLVGGRPALTLGELKLGAGAVALVRGNVAGDMPARVR